MTFRVEKKLLSIRKMQYTKYTKTKLIRGENINKILTYFKEKNKAENGLENIVKDQETLQTWMVFACKHERSP